MNIYGINDIAELIRDNSYVGRGIVIGKSADGMEKNVAYVMCNGTTNNAQKLFDYADIPTCKAAKQLFGGSKACPNGCLGLGDCEAACEFDAIHVIKGVAVVNRDKCTSCSACVKACPNSLIKIVPDNKAKVL
ncbi:MAG: 4Fe-4S binding protein, partial [Clostridia bacterium]|nr:4Fe-4S binding protein [Clostridia bacterium]